MTSKRDKICEFFGKRVHECLADMALAGFLSVDALQKVEEGIKYRIWSRIDPYRMKELADIMAWKKPRQA